MKGKPLSRAAREAIADTVLAWASVLAGNSPPASNYAVANSGDSRVHDAVMGLALNNPLAHDPAILRTATQELQAVVEDEANVSPDASEAPKAEGGS